MLLIRNSLEYPYIPQSPQIVPLVAAGLIAGAGSMLGGLFGGGSSAKAQKKTNAANLQIARENNVWNKRLQDEQNAFNLKMWDAYNQYNTPSNQRSRYEAAGINPYFALGNIDAGNAQSLISADAAPAQQVQFQAPNYDFVGQSIAQGAQTAASAVSAAQSAEQVKALQISNAYQPAIMASNLKLLNAQLENTFGDVTLKHLSAKLQRTAMNDTLSQIHQQSIGAQLDNNLKSLQYSQGVVELQIRQFYHDNMQPTEALQLTQMLDKGAAEIALLKSQKELTDKQVKYYHDTIIAQLMQASAAVTSANASMKNANTNASVASSQINANNASANASNAQAGLTMANTWTTRQQYNFWQKTLDDRIKLVRNQQVISGSDAGFRTFNNFTHSLVPIGSLPTPNFVF